MLPMRAYIEAGCAWLAAMAGVALAVWAVRELVMWTLFLAFLIGV
jgi:hypothetical protein